MLRCLNRYASTRRLLRATAACNRKSHRKRSKVFVSGESRLSPYDDLCCAPSMLCVHNSFSFAFLSIPLFVHRGEQTTKISCPLFLLCRK